MYFPETGVSPVAPCRGPNASMDETRRFRVVQHEAKVHGTPNSNRMQSELADVEYQGAPYQNFLAEFLALSHQQLLPRE